MILTNRLLGLKFLANMIMDSRFNSVYGNNNRYYNSICYNMIALTLDFLFKTRIILMECEGRYL